MTILPPLPSWDSLHPLIVHFPIGLLLTVPVFLFLSLILPKSGKGFSYSALIVMLLGTISLYLAFFAGLAAMDLVDRTQEISDMLEKHQNMAELARTLFSILAPIYLCLILFSEIFKKISSTKIHLFLNIIFLFLYIISLLAIIWTGYYGGELVHKLGVKAF